MNAEEAGLALNVIELGMLAVGGYIVYQKLFSDPSGYQEAPQFMQMVYDYKNLGKGDTNGNRDMQQFYDKWNGVFEAAQKFIDDNKINDSKTLSTTEAIGKWAGGVLKGFGKELFSAVQNDINNEKNDWSSNDPVTQQVYEIIKDQLQLVITAAQQWSFTNRTTQGAAAEQQMLLIIVRNWQSGYKPPFYTDGDINDLVNTYSLDQTVADGLRSYASQYSILLSDKAPPQKGNDALDVYLAYLYEFATQYVIGWTPSRYNDDWAHFSLLEPYVFMSDLTKEGAEQDTIAMAMLVVYGLTNKIYGAPDYATGVQGALDNYTRDANRLLVQSVAHPTPTVEYTYDQVKAIMDSWGVPVTVLSEAKKYQYAAAIVAQRNTMYAERWGKTPNPIPKQ